MDLKRDLLCAGALALALTLTACGGGTQPTAAPGPTPSPTQTAGVEHTPPLAAFTATDLEGNTVDQSILKDFDVTMFNVWGTFCTPCHAEMPDLGELNAEYADKGAQVVGIVIDVFNTDGSLDESQVELARELAHDLGADYTHLLPSGDLIRLGVASLSGVPATFFADSEGNLLDMESNGQTYNIVMGAHSKAQWADLLDEMLAKVQK